MGRAATRDSRGDKDWVTASKVTNKVGKVSNRGSMVLGFVATAVDMGKVKAEEDNTQVLVRVVG